MKRIRFVGAVLLLPLLLGVSGCSRKTESEKKACHIVLEEGEGYRAAEAARMVESGSDVTYEIQLQEGYQFLGTDYGGNYDFVRGRSGNSVSLTLYEVKYSETICPQVQKGKYVISYDANGGTPLDGSEERVSIHYSGKHLRINTSIGTDLFAREGYTLLGWNTKADGSGEAVGLGSRVNREEGLTLFAQWVPWTEASEFSYKKEAGFAVITGYTGKEEQICVPASLDGLPVRTIAEEAFAGTVCSRVILPPGIYEIEKWAFRDSLLTELYFFDDLQKVSDYAFEGCGEFQTLHINAIEAPAYSGNYFDTFQDKYDRLLELKNKKKIVLFSGSSTRFGYDSSMISRAFQEYEVVNMGVFAYSPALPQLMLILDCMQEGDILIDSPEFDAADRQFCSQKELDYAVFAMMESCYDAFAKLDLREFTQVFTAFTAYQSARADMERKSYEISASDYDEDGNPVTESSYNAYGDYILYRPNASDEQPVYGLPLDYTTDAFPKAKYIDSINEVYQRFLDKGAKIYFTYAPRNQYALSEESTLEEREKLQEYFKENLIVPVISGLEDSLYSGIYLYGTDNHLSTEGAEIRTKRVIRDLQEQLKKEAAE